MNRHIFYIYLMLVFFSIALIPTPGFCATTVTYQYDSLNRLTKVRHSSGTVISYTYDPAGNRLSKIIQLNPSALKGDLNDDGFIDLADAVIALMISSGIYSPDIRSDYVTSGVDINGDNQAGNEEAIFILQKIGGKRP